MQGAYADHILDSSDVCNNCLLRNRVERVDPVRGSLTNELDSSLERHKLRTSIGYGPADRVSEVKGTFCNCGAEGPYARIWDSDDVTDEKFRELLKSLLRTLEEKDVTVDRKRVVSTALSAWYRDGDVDEALSEGVEMGIVASLAAEASEARV